MPKGLGGREHHVGRTGDQVLRPEDAIDARFREEMAHLVGELPRQFARGALGRRQRGVDHPLAHARRDPVPGPPRGRRARRQPVEPGLHVAAIPRVERRAGHLELAQCVAHRQIRAFDEANDLVLLGRRDAGGGRPRLRPLRGHVCREVPGGHDLPGEGPGCPPDLLRFSGRALDSHPDHEPRRVDVRHRPVTHEEDKGRRQPGWRA